MDKKEINPKLKTRRHDEVVGQGTPSPVKHQNRKQKASPVDDSGLGHAPAEGAEAEGSSPLL